MKLKLRINILKEHSALTYIIIFFSVVLIGAMMNCIAFLLPMSKIHQHIIDSADTFRQEGAFPYLIKEYTNSIPDNNTDAWMLLMADYENSTVALLEKAFSGYFYFYNENPVLWGIDNLVCLNGENESLWTGYYARYWHGWLLPLRVLLLFFDYSDIRVLNFFIHIFLTAGVIVSMSKKNLQRYVLALTVALVALMIHINTFCMAYSIAYFIMCAASIWIMRYEDEKEKNIPAFFMVIGMLTAYFEFLTYPLITLAFPLIFYYLLMDSKQEGRNHIKSLIGLSVMWMIGYLGMWFSKWIIGTVFTDINVFADAYQQMVLRLSDHPGYSSEDSVSRFYVVIENFSRLSHRPFYLLFFLSILYSMRDIRKGFAWRKLVSGIRCAIPYLCIALYPVVWWMLFANHSYLHAHFTYKLSAISVFAGLCALTKISQTGKTLTEA